MARKEQDRRLAEAKENSRVDLDVASPQERAGITQEGFHDALKRASRKIEPNEEKDEQ